MQDFPLTGGDHLTSMLVGRLTSNRGVFLAVYPRILDREFDRWQVVFNPVFERALEGPGTGHGWNFEPAFLVRWKRKKFSPSLEYYGEIESIALRPHAQPELHQLFFGGDWEVGSVFKVNLGVGFDLAGRGPGVVMKSRFEWNWDAQRNR